MSKTKVSIHGKAFWINGKPTYSEIPQACSSSLGLLWNQRFVQGVFDDCTDRARYHQASMYSFDPEQNTDSLIEALPQWYAYGLRAFTVGFQGGWPVGLFERGEDMDSISNNPFGEDGASLDEAYAARMDRLIRAADEIGMVVIVNVFYWAQTKRLKTGRTIETALKTACTFLRHQGYTNVMLDVANEYCLPLLAHHPMLNTQEGMSHMLRLAKEWSSMPCSASTADRTVHPQVIQESDYILIHGNALTKGELFQYVKEVQVIAGDKPVLCNEDSPCITRIDPSLELGVSWGYYNNYTKQIPPCQWGVTQGEDMFFARRMARAIGIELSPLAPEEQFYLQGLEPWSAFGNQLRVLRVAAEYPEKIRWVRFYLNGQWMDTSYDEPFFLYTECTWLGKPIRECQNDHWSAVVTLVDGSEIVLGS